MTQEDRERIISNDYADLLIEYSGNLSILNSFENATVQIINDLIALVHVPASTITDNTIYELGYSVMPSLFGLVSEASLEASGVFRLRNIPNLNLRGQGVLIGIIDSGIDYTNPIFQYADGTSRIAYIWDQTIFGNNYPEDFFYGTEYSREQINEALQSDNPLSIVPVTDEVGHGTMVAGIAAGNTVPESNFSGVAPDTELVVVKLKQAKPYLKEFFRVPENVVCYQENDIMFGVEYLIRKAFELRRPMAICLAIGTSQGAHDGMGTLSSMLSNYAAIPGIAIVVAAGNEGNDRRHYYGEVDKVLGYDTVELSVGENESGFSMELWGNSPTIFSIDVLSPSGEYVPRIGAVLDQTVTLNFIFESTVIVVDYQTVESQSGDQLILMRFSNPAPGIWRFRVYGEGTLTMGFHIWLPMEGFISDNTFFIRPNIYTTILSLGNATFPLTVTAYNDADDSLYASASRGFTRINFIKPEITAPGVNILGPTPNQGFAPYTGTSAAAAHTTGIAAMLLEWAIINNNYPDMNTIDLKAFLIRGARRDLELEYPNRDWGFGILDIFNVFDILRSGI